MYLGGQGIFLFSFKAAIAPDSPTECKEIKTIHGALQHESALHTRCLSQSQFER